VSGLRGALVRRSSVATARAVRLSHYGVGLLHVGAHRAHEAFVFAGGRGLSARGLSQP